VRDGFALQPSIASPEGWRAGAGDERLRALVEQGLLVAERKNRDVAPPGPPFEDHTSTAHPLGPSRFLAVSVDALVPPLVVEEGALVVWVLSLLTRPVREATEQRLRDEAEPGHAILMLPEGAKPSVQWN
jgi:hypothetical protein